VESRRLSHPGGMLLGWERFGLYFRASPLRGARFVGGLSQEELAAKVGTTRQTISALERGTSIPSVSLALALARALGCSVEELFANVDGG
jgi:putative transcriptional regulator